MYASWALLFYILLNTSSVFCDGETETDSQIYLPFAVMHRKDGSFLFPRAVEEGTFKENIGFTGDLKFTKYDTSDDQMFFCPPNTTEEKAKIELANSLFDSDVKFEKYFGYKKIDKGCLQNNKFKRQDILRCSSQALPTPTLRMKIEETNDAVKLISCGAFHKGTMHSFLYEICPSITLQERAVLVKSHSRSIATMNFFRKVPFRYEEVAIYEICFNFKANGTVYTKHTLSSLPLLFDKRFQHERAKKFEISTNGYEYYSNWFEKAEQFYKKLENTVEDDDNPKVPFKAHFLVSPDDMSTAIIRKSAFHYINVKPMHENLIVLWDFIEDTIRRVFKDTNIPYDVYTGAFLASNEQDYSKIPDLWIRILYYDYKSITRLNPAIAIVMKNNDPNDTNDISLDNYCQVDYCDPQRNGSILEEKFPRAREILRCCLLNPKIQNLFGLELKVETLLEIPGLTNIKMNARL